MTINFTFYIANLCNNYYYDSSRYSLTGIFTPAYIPVHFLTRLKKTDLTFVTIM